MLIVVLISANTQRSHKIYWEDTKNPNIQDDPEEGTDNPINVRMTQKRVPTILMLAIRMTQKRVPTILTLAIRMTQRGY